MRCLTLLLLSSISAVHAHDPYEITSVVYVQSNRIEVFAEFEFPTGMRMAGLEPKREVAAVTQFESAYARLLQMAGGFFNFTAGNNAVRPLRTNVSLAVEDHIRVQIDFDNTSHRPLQFTVPGLGHVPDAPYGTTLTVLDMVNQKVLGQTTLFADSPQAEFPPRNQVDAPAPPEDPPATNLAIASDQESPAAPPETNMVAGPPEPPAEGKTISHQQGLSWLIVGLGIATFVTVIIAVLRRQD